MDARTPDAIPPDDPRAESPERRDERLAARLRALAHPARMEVLRTLARQDRCVCGEIVRGLPLAQSTVSEHLRVLSSAQLVSSKSEGQRSCYGLDKEGVRALKDELDRLFSQLLADLSADPGEGPAPDRD